MTRRGDGDWNDDDLPVTISTRTVSGDIFSDQSMPLRFTDPTTGAGLFTTNTDPSVVGVDPLTGEDAPVGTDVGFGAAVRRYIQTGVLNGDFALPPPDPERPIDNTENPLPYWTWTPPADGNQIAYIDADSSSASGYRVKIVGLSASGDNNGTLDQWVPVPRSQGQQYRVVASCYSATSNTAFRSQFYTLDGVAIGSAVTNSTTSASGEVKGDLGLVPATASYVLIRANVPVLLGTGYLNEVRVAFLPAEATVGLRSTTANVGAITTTQTQVVGVTIPAGSLTVGSVYEFEAWGNVTSSAANVVTMRLRIGTTTLTGNIIDNVAPTATTTASNNSFHLTGMVTVRAVGASGTIIGGIQFIGQDTQPFTVRLRASQATGTVAVDTTVANILELTIVTAAGTTQVTVQQATIKCVMAS